jgi:hypothetical protein
LLLYGFACNFVLVKWALWAKAIYNANVFGNFAGSASITALH